MTTSRGLLAALCLALGHSAASAQNTYVWTAQKTSDFWNNGADWLGGAPPPSTGDPNGIFIFQGYGSPTVGSIATSNNLGHIQFNIFRFDSSLTARIPSSTDFGFGVTSFSPSQSFQTAGTEAQLQIAGLGTSTIRATSHLTLNGDLRVGGVGGPADVFGLGSLIIADAVSVGSHTLIIGNGASGNAPTANTRVVVLSGQNTFSAGGGVVLDGGTLSLGGATGGNSGLGTIGGTFTVTANGGKLMTDNVNIVGIDVSNVQLDGDLEYVGLTSLTINNAFVHGAGNLTVRTRNILTLKTASNDYTGVVTSTNSQLPDQGGGAAGGFTLSGANGSLLGVSTFNFFAGGTLTLSDNIGGQGTNGNRIADAATINLRNGNLVREGGASAGDVSTETVGTVTGAGYSTITAVPGAGAGYTAITLGSLQRVERGTFLFRGTALGSAGSGNVGNVLFSTAPTGDLVGGGGAAGTTNISILPYAIGDTSASGVGTTTGSFVTLGPNGVRPLATSEYQANNFAGTDQNVRLTAATANAGSAAINSLLIASGGSITGAGTLNVTSGAILNQNGSATIANNLAFGGAEAQFFTPANLRVNGNLSGANGLTKSGNNLLTLSGDNTGLAGTLTLNAGQIVFNSASALPGTGTIVVNGPAGTGSVSTDAGLVWGGSGAYSLTRDVSIGSGWVAFRTTTNGASFNIASTISGNGGVSIDATGGQLVLAGANTYAGATRLRGGLTRISGEASLGNGGGVDFAAGSTNDGVVLDGDWITSRHITFSSSGSINSNGHNAVWNGVVTGNGTFNKSGPGSLTLNAPAPFTGTVSVAGAGSVLRLAQNAAINSQNNIGADIAVGSNASLILDNGVLPANVTPSANVVTNRLPDLAVISMSGKLRLIGNASASITERLGNVSVSGSPASVNAAVIEVDAVGAQSAAFSLNNLTPFSGPMTVRGTNLGLPGVAGRVFLSNFNGTAPTNGQLLANVYADDPNHPVGVEWAIYDTTNGVRAAKSSDFLNGAAIQNAAPTNLPTTANFRVNSAVANPVPIVDAANTINSLRFAPGSVADYNAAVDGTLTVTTGQVLTEGGGAAAALTNSGAGRLTITSGSAPMVVAANADVSLQAAIGGSGGVLKVGTGTLTLAAPLNNTGTLTLSEGTVAAVGAGLNANGNLFLRNVRYAGGITSATIEFADTLGNGASFLTSATIANDFRVNGGGSFGSNFTNSDAGLTTVLTGLISGGSATRSVRFDGTTSGPSTIVLANPNNSFVGRVSVGFTTLAVASNGALGDASNAVGFDAAVPASRILRFDADFTGANTLNRSVDLTGAGAFDTNGHTVDAPNMFSGDGAFTKQGAGTLILGNVANTHTGAINVNAGRLLVNGDVATSTNAVTVANGATLGGNGIINRATMINAGGHLAPGASIGTLTVSNSVTFNGSMFGGWDIELNAFPANTPATAAGSPDVDILALTGANSNLNLVLSSSNPLRINLTALTTGFSFDQPVNYVIATADSGSNFLTNGSPFTFDPNNFFFYASNFAGGTDYGLSIDANRLLLSFRPVNPVPEPASWMLIGLAALVVSRRVRRLFSACNERRDEAPRGWS